MGNRNRASGWQYAKTSGHKNEALVSQRLEEEEYFRENLLKRINRPANNILRNSFGGLHETSVQGVNGIKTKSKTDLKIYLNNNEVINISIKKSGAGQVYLVSAQIFMESFEKQFHTKIPVDVKRAINLFWSGADDAVSIIEQYGDKRNKRTYNLQLKHKSLNATTLEAYDQKLYNALLNWCKDNAYEITKLSFSMGAVSDCKEWSDFVWYINLLHENNFDAIFSIKDICKRAKEIAEHETYYNSRNGGTTINLPFGSVQWHKECLQFRHDIDKIQSLLNTI